MDVSLHDVRHALVELGRLRFGEMRVEQPRRLVVDMAGVGFADCAAVRLIVATGRSLPAGQPACHQPSAAPGA